MSFHDPVEWWNSITHKYVMGHGQTSTAYAVSDGNDKYIVRVTPIHNPMQRMRIEHEIKLYNKIMQIPTYTKHVSELLFAHCPRHYSQNDTENLAFFVFQFRMGLPLDTFLNYLHSKHFQINPATTVKWRNQLRETLDFLESLHIVHRDIKPANMFMNTEEDKLLLFDFEMACINLDNGCTTTDFIGTRKYASPAALSLLQSGWQSHIYTRKDDEYAIDKMFETDIDPLV